MKCNTYEKTWIKMTTIMFFYSWIFCLGVIFQSWPVLILDTFGLLIIFICISSDNKCQYTKTCKYYRDDSYTCNQTAGMGFDNVYCGQYGWQK